MTCFKEEQLMNLNRIVESYREDIIRAVQELVRIPSVESGPMSGMPFGEGPNRALEYALSLSESLGFRVGNVDGYAGYAEFGQGDKTLGILVHLDVVPEGGGWTYPPYGAEIHDGRIYGRGTMDDKGPAIGALYAMKAVMDSGLKLNKKARIIFGLDEESGWEDMEAYFAREPMPDMGLTPDGDYPVIHAEKGILDIAIEGSFAADDCISVCVDSITGGHRPNMVPDTCTCIFQQSSDSEKVLTHLKSFNEYSGYGLMAEFLDDGRISVTAGGVSAHGSTPEKGKNAIGRMLAFLSTLGLGSSAMERYILLLNDMLGTDTTGRELGIALSDEVSGALTLNLGTLRLNRNEASAVINVRYPVTVSGEEIVKSIENAVSDKGAAVRVLGGHKPLYVPEDHFLIQSLKRVYTEQTGQEAKVLAIGGGTYARVIENAVAFGAQFPGRPELAHQRDEYIEIEDLILHTKIYANAIAALCTD